MRARAGSGRRAHLGVWGYPGVPGYKRVHWAARLTRAAATDWRSGELQLISTRAALMAAAAACARGARTRWWRHACDDSLFDMRGKVHKAARPTRSCHRELGSSKLQQHWHTSCAASCSSAAGAEWLRPEDTSPVGCVWASEPGCAHWHNAAQQLPVNRRATSCSTSALIRRSGFYVLRLFPPPSFFSAFFRSRTTNFLTAPFLLNPAAVQAFRA